MTKPTKREAEKRVVKAVMRRFRAKIKEFGSLEKLLAAAPASYDPKSCDELIESCAALAKLKKGAK